MKGWSVHAYPNVIGLIMGLRYLRYRYRKEMFWIAFEGSYIISYRGAPSDIINMDIHYQNGRIVVYRTDVTFTWLDLMGLFIPMKMVRGSKLFSFIYFSLIQLVLVVLLAYFLDHLYSVLSNSSITCYSVFMRTSGYHIRHWIPQPKLKEIWMHHTRQRQTQVQLPL